MSIDIRREQLLTFAQAAKVLPSDSGKPIALSTLHRWRMRGIKGVKLETVLVGGRRYTSLPAIERFSAATTAAADGTATPLRTPRQRAAAQRRAESELDAAGI